MPMQAQGGGGSRFPNYSHPNTRRRCSASRCGRFILGEEPMPNPKLCPIICQNEFIPVQAMRMLGGVKA
jgi:hypothetical protein